ncbi:MAG: glycine cleavage system aminomethyltransferase GcvT [Chloroflexi bacterium]|nr:glycine cleavage system aminomethyltransferase GcvT [Chloroflexota bacterium]
MNDATGTLRTTCLYQQHLALGGRMVPFAGWSMPVQYGGILEEHRAVRNAAGMFDVSHMGRLELSGADCVPYLQRIFTCDVARLEPGAGRYTLICAEDGGILDDTILYCRRPDSFLLVCNAANTPAVLDWLRRWREPGSRVALEDRTAATGMIALQGPQAAERLVSLADPALVRGLAYFRWCELTVAGQSATVARTGYTGEDGFEIIAPAEHVAGLWQRLLEGGVTPCGLGARDTLRLEAALPLHGNDISPETDPVQAGLLWTVALDKGPFIGREAILRAKTEGTPQRLIGFELVERGIPRPHHRILAGGQEVGVVTSGGYAPTLNKGIGMGYVLSAHARVGTEIAIDVRGNAIPARVVRRPFYKRPE